ncbi:hypothetical protein [Anaerosacchariphilus polymeriproducens]|nr:hypothetical protein [Anaerosacchariphilus polymeriproducens]
MDRNIIFENCDYLNENRNDEFAPLNQDCRYCYRYELCKGVKEKKEKQN